MAKLICYPAGHYFYTLGQRARLGGLSSPHYVVSKCPERNTVTVAQGAAHPALYTHSFLATPPHWIHESHDLQNQSKQCQVRTNHGAKTTVPAELSLANSSGIIRVSTTLPLRAITAGQVYGASGSELKSQIVFCNAVCCVL